MRVIVIVRTRNEERNIARFCQAYTWADKILVADGGSDDDTVLIAKTFPNVVVRPYLEKVKMDNDLWRNPEGEHIQFLNEWAQDEENPDWILFDDCDCVPNCMLKNDFFWIMEDHSYDTVYAVRLYLWGEDKHFLDLAQPRKRDYWETSLWGWKPESGMKFHSNPETGIHEHRPKRDFYDRMNIFPPYCLLHRPWPDEEATNKKVEFYRKSGQIPSMRHPLEFGGELFDLPDWAVE